MVPATFPFMNHCWILVGMMGSGKSTVGKALADLTGRTFNDTDAMIQARLGRTISQIFQVYGEEAFRDHETSLLKSLAPDNSVISTGGGIVVREANWTEMRRLGTTVFLDADHSTLVDRLERSKRKRPLLEVPDWKERLRNLMEQRRSYYEKADITFKVSDAGLEESAERLVAILNGGTKC